MKALALTFAAAALTGLLLPAHALSAQAASMRIGLVIQDSCRIEPVSAASNPSTPSTAGPKVTCALKHPFRLTSRIGPAVSAGKGPVPEPAAGSSAPPAWVVEF